jgi:CheY-like chemotaxis protein
MMTYLDNAITAETILPGDMMFADRGDRMPAPASRPDKFRPTARANQSRRMPLIVVLEDGPELSDTMRALCDFLSISVDRINSNEDLLPLLQRGQPMAVVAAMDAAGQDGGNVLMTVARHDPTLPVLLMTDGDPVLAGAVDAVTELWGLTQVVQTAACPSPGALAEFLCRAGLRGNCLALLPI